MKEGEALWVLGEAMIRGKTMARAKGNEYLEEDEVWQVIWDVLYKMDTEDDVPPKIKKTITERYGEVPIPPREFNVRELAGATASVSFSNVQFSIEKVFEGIAGMDYGIGDSTSAVSLMGKVLRRQVDEKILEKLK